MSVQIRRSMGSVVALGLAVATMLAPRPAKADALWPYSGAVLTLINQQRAARRLPLLNRESLLEKVAYNHASDMAYNNLTDHKGSDSSYPDERITWAGYNWAWWGENVAAGYSTPQAVMTAWMNSPGHRANILNPNFRDCGIVCFYLPGSQYGYYWCLDFGRRR